MLSLFPNRVSRKVKMPKGKHQNPGHKHCLWMASCPSLTSGCPPIVLKIDNCLFLYLQLESHPLGGNVLIERVNGNHVGHILDSGPDKAIRQVCPELEQKIRSWIELGVKSDVILVNSHRWARENGVYDIEDAQFVVTPSDIKNIRKKYLRSVRFDENDSTSLHNMVTETFKGDVIYYQRYIFGEQPLILVLQSDEMKQDLSECSSKMIFMDATNGVNKYGYPLWSILVANKFGRGVPVAHIIASSETEDIIATALSALKTKVGLNPR